MRPSRPSLAIVGQPDTPRERADAARNRTRILQAARKLLRRRHLDELCMDEVAALAGVGKGTLYRRFADRSALLRALLDEDERVLQDAAAHGFGLPRGAGAAQRLSALFDALIEFHLDHARVLAVVESSVRPFSRFDNAPYLWRHVAVTRGFEACGASREADAALLADVALQALSGEVLLRAIERAGPQQTREALRTFFAKLIPHKTRFDA